MEWLRSRSCAPSGWVAARWRRRCAASGSTRLYDHRAITDVIARTNGHRGKAALARAVCGEPKLTRSELEARFLALVRQAGLPEPLSNYVLDAPDHPRLEVDFSWPAHRLVVETELVQRGSGEVAPTP